MSLEQLIVDLTASLDRNTAAHTASAAAMKGAAPAGAAVVKAGATVTPIKPGGKIPPGEPTAPEVEFDVVKLAASKVSDALGKPFARKIIKDIGQAADLASVKPNRYYLLVAAFEKALTPKQETAEIDEDEDGL